MFFFFFLFWYLPTFQYSNIEKPYLDPNKMGYVVFATRVRILHTNCSCSFYIFHHCIFFSDNNRPEKNLSPRVPTYVFFFHIFVKTGTIDPVIQCDSLDVILPQLTISFFALFDINDVE